MTKASKQKMTRHMRRSVDLLVGLVLLAAAYTVAENGLTLLVMLGAGTYNFIMGLNRWVDYLNKSIRRENRA